MKTIAPSNKSIRETPNLSTDMDLKKKIVEVACFYPKKMLENPGKTPVNPRETPGKPRENPGKILGKPGENPRKTPGKPRENQ